MIRERLLDMRTELHNWIEASEDFQHNLKSLATELDSRFKNVNRAKMFGSVAGIGGGVMTTIGFGLSFLTFGASTPLIVAGSIIAGAGGVTVGGSCIIDYLTSKIKQGSAEEKYKIHRRKILEIKGQCLEINGLLEKIGQIELMFPEWKTFWTKLIYGPIEPGDNVKWEMVVETMYEIIKVSKGGAQVSQLGIRVTKSVFKTLGRAGKVGHVAGGVLGVVFIPIDIYTFISSLKNLEKPHEVSNEIRGLVSKTRRRTPTREEVNVMIDRTLEKIR